MLVPGSSDCVLAAADKGPMRNLKHLQSEYGPRGAFFPGDVANSLKLDRRTVLRAYQRFEEANILGTPPPPMPAQPSVPPSSLASAT